MKSISKREEQILIAIWNLKESAYLLAIKDHLSKIMETQWSIGAIHKPLMKLEKEGLVESYLGEATAKRGGRSKKIYRVSRLGLKTLQAIKEKQETLWANFPAVKKA